MREYCNHIKTSNSVIMTFTEGKPITIVKEHESFNKVIDLLSQRKFSEAAKMADKTLLIASTDDFEVIDGRVYIDEEPLPVALSERLVQFIDNDIDYQPLVRFWNKLKTNPAQSAKEDLYAFLEANKVPLTADGDFIAYKYVKKDYFDAHTGKISNKPGSVVKMPREQVDSNRNNTCSTGLHVGAFAYVNQYGGGNEMRILEVQVSPENVVSVPVDYDHQKMRVCEYMVLKDCTKELLEPLYGHQPVQKTNNHNQPLTKICRMPKNRSRVSLDSRNRLAIGSDLLIKLGYASGSDVDVHVFDRRIEVGNKTDNKQPNETLVIGKNITYIPIRLLKAANIDIGKIWYLSYSNGSLIIS